MKALVLNYVKAFPAYLMAAWQTVHYFYSLKLAAMAAGVVLACLLLRVLLGGIGGKAVRLIVYGGLFYFVSSREEFRALFADQTSARIIAGVLVVGLWLPVTIVGGLVRLIFRSREPEYLPPPPASGQGAGSGQPFNVSKQESEKKQIMVIMMTDIVGYSARMEKDEAATYTLLKEHNVIVRKAIAANKGKEIKTIGDAFMVVFNEPLDGLRCGIAIQKELAKFNKPRPGNDQLKIRIGIHRGEVIVTSKDVFGEGVNIAARMESITDPGGISISADVHDNVKNKVEAGFQSMGVVKMKNIANPPEVYRVHINYG